MEVRIISDSEGLAEHVAAWEMLAADALEPNPFYEHWMLLPAIRHFGGGKDLKFLLVFQNGTGQSPSVLCGMFPLERIRPYMGLPVGAWSIWKYNHCPLTMPLIRKNCAREVLAALFDWLASAEAGGHLLDWRYVLGEGVFHQILVDQLHAMGEVPLIWEWFTRALFRPLETADRYITTALSGKHRKAFKRRSELLADLGPPEFRVADEGADIADWIESFLRIESSGWKGREGSAMACSEANRSFFVEAVSGAFRKRRLLMTAMDVGGKTIAQNCYFRVGAGSFHFKPAFDEEYARFSPGFHMECELIRYLHGQSEIEWMDSCTSSGNEMYNRLFIARRTIQSLIIPTRGGVGGFLVSAIPCLRYLKRTARARFTSARNRRAESEITEGAK
jgi:CelD/BcsL family acetyltransferase involved in cellulose biosynthesis